jgi:hypothetical protein
MNNPDGYLFLRHDPSTQPARAVVRLDLRRNRLVDLGAAVALVVKWMS